MDALVSLMILATLGLLVLGLLSLSYQRLRGLEAEVRSCLDEYASTISTE